MTNEEEISLKMKCLNLAAGVSTNGTDIRENAELFLKFCTGKQSEQNSGEIEYECKTWENLAIEVRGIDSILKDAIKFKYNNEFLKRIGPSRDLYAEMVKKEIPEETFYDYYTLNRRVEFLEKRAGFMLNEEISVAGLTNLEERIEVLKNTSILICKGLEGFEPDDIGCED
jgi:hypothetical protein